MNIRTVKRSQIKISKKSASKYKPLLEHIKKLKPGGEAIEVGFKDESELNSMRNVVYAHNRETGEKIKTSKHPREDLVYFFKGEYEQ